MNSMKNYTLILATLLSLLIPMKSWGGDLDKGAIAFQKGDVVTAVEEFRPYAEQGNVRAQLLMGMAYQKGNRDGFQYYKKAVKWYTLAAEQGHPVAQLKLGIMYGRGYGVPKNYKTKIKWVMLSAEQGFDSAQYALATAYQHGIGVDKDIVSAYMWAALVHTYGNTSTSDYGKRLVGNLTVQMTPSQIKKAQRLARECVAKNYKGC